MTDWPRTHTPATSAGVASAKILASASVVSRAIGLEDRVGDLAVGKDFDAVWLRPADKSTLAVNLRHARDTADALARIFALATPADVAGVWVRGLRVESAACPDPR